MGEAKRRGTYEQRVAEGEAKRLEREAKQFAIRRDLGMRRGKSRLPALLAIAAAAAHPLIK
jgi:hypothetical protein